jgi:hypothetical protein
MPFPGPERLTDGIDFKWSYDQIRSISFAGADSTPTPHLSGLAPGSPERNNSRGNRIAG